MDERHPVLTELEQARERAAGLLRAKLEAVASQFRDATARIAADLEVVVPPDLEMLLPLSPAARLLKVETPPPPPPSVTLDAVRQLDAGRAQSEVLKELLSQLEGFCGARAILVFRDGEALGWHGAGFEDVSLVRNFRARLADSRALTLAAEGTPVLVEAAVDPALDTLLEGASRALLVPMSLRGKVVGAALAAARDGVLVHEPLQLLTYLAGVLLETLAVRPTVPTPALAEPLLLEAPAVQPAAAEVDVPAEAPTPFEEVAAPPLAEAAAVEVEAAPPAAEPVVAPPLQPVAAAAAEAVRSPEEEQQHKEAQRFARLLVSEIRLYNEQAVQEGRASRDIYQRLKEDIDRSREMYEQRVPADVRATSNYFFEELVRILADGDPDALGV